MPNVPLSSTRGSCQSPLWCMRLERPKNLNSCPRETDRRNTWLLKLGDVFQRNFSLSRVSASQQNQPSSLMCTGSNQCTTFGIFRGSLLPSAVSESKKGSSLLYFTLFFPLEDPTVLCQAFFFLST